MVLAGFIYIDWKLTYPDNKSQTEFPALAGTYGDFLSGTLGPLLSLVSIYFVVITLREQRKTTLDERRAEQIEGFENRFYRLIDLHRANVSEMSLRNQIKGEDRIEGKRVFLRILDELQVAVKKVREQNQLLCLHLSTTDELQIAYYCVFFGINNNSTRPLFNALQLTQVPIQEEDLMSIEDSLKRSRSQSDDYFKFDGHQVRLGHYFRHLFQAVDYVDKQTVIEDKKSYVKTLRAQLSTYEQILLFVNGLTPLGWKWLDKGFIKKYGLVKNIPAGMLERYFGIDASDLFGDDYWEYEEVVERPTCLRDVRRIQIAEPSS